MKKQVVSKGDKAMRNKWLPIIGSVGLALTTISTLEAASITLQPGQEEGKDVFIRNSFGGNGSNSTNLEVGGWADSYYSYIQFDLTGLPSNATSAEVHLYTYGIFDDSYYGPPPSVNVERVTSAWDETINWNTKPSTVYTQTFAEPTEGWYIIDVKNIYNAWQDGSYQNYGIALTPTSTSNRFALFYSSDYLDDISLRPKLVVTAVPLPSALLLFTTGIAGLGGVMFRSKRK